MDFIMQLLNMMISNDQRKTWSSFFFLFFGRHCITADWLFCNANQESQSFTELKFLKSLWGLGTEEE
jgi:hypothetical protein